MGIRGSTARWLVAAAALSGVVAVSVARAQPVPAGNPTFSCESQNAKFERVWRETKLLAPADGATVAVGEPVTFAAENATTELGFGVASSPALLSNPDIAEGFGRERPPSQYTYTTTSLTVRTRIVYWDAHTRLKLGDCATPKTFTTAPRRLTVIPRRAGNVMLDEADLNELRTTQTAVVRLSCASARRCRGRLIVTIKENPPADQPRRIATASFSIAVGKTARIKLMISERALYLVLWANEPPQLAVRTARA